MYGYRVWSGVVAFVALSFALTVTRPPLFFVPPSPSPSRQHGKDTRVLRGFGTGPGKTLFPLSLALHVLAVLVAYVLAVLDAARACAVSPPPLASLSPYAVQGVAQA